MICPSAMLFVCLSVVSFLPCLLAIMVPTGKLTPISPPKPSTRALPLQPYRAPAPVVEYSIFNSEPPPLDPSYVPVTYKYLHYLVPKHLVYVPAKIKYPDVNTSLNKYNYYNIKYPQKYGTSQFYKKPYFNSPYYKKY